MVNVNPTDLGIFTEDTLPTTDPVPKQDRKPDLRTKEGRAWKRARDDALAKGEPIQLFDTETTTKPNTERSRSRKSIQPIKTVLLSVHAKLAIIFNNPDIALDDGEAALIADSGSALLSYYKIKVDGKGGAALAFLYALTLVYGLRLVAIIIENYKKNKTKDDPEPEPKNNVFVFDGAS